MNINIHHHLKLLAAGHMETLYAEMDRPRSKPTTHARQANVDERNELHFLPIDNSKFTDITLVPNMPLTMTTLALPSNVQRTDRSASLLPLTQMPSSMPFNENYTRPHSIIPYTKETSCRPATLCHKCLLPKDTDLLIALHSIKTNTSPGPSPILLISSDPLPSLHNA
jgi:hypothetical protein